MRARKSTFCTHNACICVEVLSDVWSRPSSQEQDAPEVEAAPGQMVVRNSGDPKGPKVGFTHAEWRAFVAGVKRGEFDIPDSDVA